VHRDDFDRLDTATWGVYDGPGNGQTGPRSSVNTFVDQGRLVLRTAPVDGQWHGAGVSSAPGGWTQTYGKYLVRLRFEEGYGVRAVALLWPTSPWPPEVDFFEVPATVPDRSSGLLTNHYTDSSDRRGMERLRVRADFTRWHTVGVEWTPESLTYTLDGAVVGKVTDEVPDEPMWLGMQTAQGLVGEGIVPDEARTPSVDLFVDWVEVHRYTGEVPTPEQRPSEPARPPTQP
jgi:beta-glucanase (GH16 family)